MERELKYAFAAKSDTQLRGILIWGSCCFSCHGWCPYIPLPAFQWLSVAVGMEQTQCSLLEVFISRQKFLKLQLWEKEQGAGPAEGPGAPLICLDPGIGMCVQINIYFLRVLFPISLLSKCTRIICRKTFRFRSKQENEAGLSSERAKLLPLPSQKIVSDFD